MFLNPLVPTAVTLLLVVTGGLGSIFSTELRNAFPFAGPPYQGISWWAVTWWSLALFTSLVFFLRQDSTNFARQEAQQNLEQQAKKLERLIRTMPPESFLEQFVQAYIIADTAFHTMLDQEDEEREAAVHDSIRIILKAIAILAKQFDGDRQQTRYAANIMIFHGAESLTANPTRKQELQAATRFCDPATDIGLLRGVLELVPAFFMTDTDEDELEISHFVLPVPATAKNHQDRFLVLPGAPLAFVTGSASGHEDTRKIRKWFEDYGDFTEGVMNEIEGYFQDNEEIRSFLSIPIFGSDELAEGGTSVGVLNIHSDHTNFLRGGLARTTTEGELSHFLPIVQPFIFMLAKLLRSHPAPP